MKKADRIYTDERQAAGASLQSIAFVEKAVGSVGTRLFQEVDTRDCSSRLSPAEGLNAARHH